MIRIDHHADDELARIGFPWTVAEDGHPYRHFRTHREALQYCLKRMEQTDAFDIQSPAHSE